MSVFGRHQCADSLPVTHVLLLFDLDDPGDVRFVVDPLAYHVGVILCRLNDQIGQGVTSANLSGIEPLSP